MTAILQEWGELVLRWAHVIAAIMWVGDSFLFMWLDSKLRKAHPARTGELIGELWMAHGGGFYEVVKRKSLESIPDELHTFKWESYATWITGFLLLILVYWAGGRAMLLDAASPTAHATAIGLSASTLFGTTALYHLLCRTPLVQRPAAMGLVGLLAVAGGGWALLQVLTPRAAFLQVGATLGTIMASNVLLTIIPAQREMMAATREGRAVDTRPGAKAKLRSTHNHYLTLPVLLTMLSNHFPSLYGGPYAFAVLTLVCVLGVGVKIAMNQRRATPLWIWGGTLVALVGAMALTVPTTGAADDPALLQHRKVAFSEVRTIMAARCVSCHAETPSFQGFAAPPQGVVLETAGQIQAQAQRILVRTVQTKTMPLGNLTAMTDAERLLVGAWIVQGADVDARAEAAK